MATVARDDTRPRAVDDLSPGALALDELRRALETPGWRGFTFLRRYRRENPGPVRALARQLASVRWDARADYAARLVRFAFVSIGSTANLEDALLLESLDRGIVPVSYHAASRQPSRELRDPGSGLAAHQPDVVVVAPAPPPPGPLEAAAAEAFVDALAEDLRAFRARSSALLLVHNFLAPELRPRGLGDWRDAEGLGPSYARANLALAERCRDIPDVYIVDLAHAAALSGGRWWTLHRSWFVANLGVPEDLAVSLTREYAAAGAALRGFVRKCLVLDLDDTLWGGVVGEVGAGGIQLGTDYPGNIFAAVQDVARQLHDRGVVLALNSQNHEEDAWAPFQGRPEMRLQRAHLAGWRINWKDKAANLVELAEELRLGLDSFVMLDNDPVQQAWVEDRLPEVHVLPGRDPLEMLQSLVSQRLFESLGHTSEDERRGRSYVAASRRREEEAAAADREAFLAGLDLAVTVGRARPEHVARLAQLAQRTNQFNLTTVRYTEGQIRELGEAPDAAVLYCCCRDRFADEGVIGLVILRGPGPEWSVDSFLLSCRVLGRGVEKAVAAAMCRLAASRGATALRGEYVRSAKNGITESFYRDLGFAPVESGPERSSWRLALPAAGAAPPPWIDLAVAEEAR